MNPDHRAAFRSSLYAKSRSFTPPRRLEPAEILDVCQEVACSLIDEAVKASKKERSKSQVDPRAGDILNVFPRREGGQAALLSISKAIARDGFDVVLDRTSEYAQAVARWAHGRKRDSKGASLIPMPTTFFNNFRYMDDPAQWWEGTGGKPKADKPHQLPEPEGWRFAHPESRYVTENEPWDRIDLITQQWIINNTPKNENTA
jgi:hypothetical protein